MNIHNLPVRLVAMLAVLAALAVPPAALRAQITNPVKLVKGTITSSTSGKPVEGGRVFVYQTSNNEILYRSKINPSTGAYQLILNPLTTYRFVLLSPLYHTTEAMISTPEGNNYEEIDTSLKMAPIIKGEATFSGRIFAPNGVDLKITPDFQKATDLLKLDRAVIVTYTVRVDGIFTKPAPPRVPGTKPKAGGKGKKKGGKKPVETAPQPETMAPAPAVDSLSTPEAQMRILLQKRAEALKMYFKSQGISLTQALIRTDATPVGPSQPNVTAAVTSFDTDIDYENIED